MYELASDARNTANPAISSGVDPLPKEQFFKKAISRHLIF